MNSATSFNTKDPETWLHTYSRNFVTVVDPGPRKIKQPIILCLQQKRVSTSVMNGSTIVSQVENWMTEMGEARGRGLNSVFLPLFLPNKHNHPCCRKFNKTLLQAEAFTAYRRIYT